MAQTLPAEIQQLRSLTKDNPGLDGMLNAMLVLLDNASDSSLIVNALNGINPAQYDNAALRQKAADLLADAGDHVAAARWQMPDQDSDDNSNVISFSEPDQGRRNTARQTHVGGIDFGSIGGLENVKAQVRRKIINPFLNKGLFQKFKRSPGGGVLMYGPPGCGKTMLARALANECKADFIEVRASDILDPLVGNAEKRIAALFQQTRKARPAVLFFDEMEALAQRRQFNATTQVNTVVSALLNEMDGFQGDNEGILFLGATNVPWSIDGAFRRPGRFDRTIFVPPPDKVARQFILNTLVGDRPCDERLDLKPVVERTSGYSGADLSAVMETAVDYAIEESELAGALVPVSNGHFRDALAEVRSSTGEWLGQARNFGEYANQDGLYDDLRDFLKKHGG